MITTRLVAWSAASYLVLLALGCGDGDTSDGGRRPGLNQPLPRAGSPAAAGSGGANFGNATGGRAGTLAPVTPGPSTVPVGDRQKKTIDDCQGTAPGAAQLTAANLPAASARWLYPYAETVFPRGLTAPFLQWSENPSGANAVMIHMRSMLLDHRICLPLSEAANVQIPQEAWDRAGEQSLGKGDPLTIDVAIASGGSAQKLPTLPVVFALANLRAPSTTTPTDPRSRPRWARSAAW